MGVVTRPMSTTSMPAARTPATKAALRSADDSRLCCPTAMSWFGSWRRYDRRRRSQGAHAPDGADALPLAAERKRGLRDVEALRQDAGARAEHVLHRAALQPGGDLPAAARAVRGRL